MKNLMWLEKGINNHNTTKWVWYLVGVVKLVAWFVVVPKFAYTCMRVCVSTAAYIRNRVAASALHEKTPFEICGTGRSLSSRSITYEYLAV